MSFYGQKNYNDKMGGGNGGKPAYYTIAQTGCFVTAFCNLEQRFGKNIDPPSLNRLFTERGIYIDVDDGVKDDVGWQSITAYDGQIHVTSVNGGGWPADNNSIVKFAYTSPKTGQAITHFCLVADAAAHTIIDSWDGVVRSPGYYGNPVASATYANVTPEPVTPAPRADPPAAVTPQSTATSGAVVTLQKGDTISAIALRYNISAQAILDHNGISWNDARNLPVGYQVRLPIATAPAQATSGYTIEMLAAPKVMHVSKPDGAEKWAFGNIKSWSDFVSTGHVAGNTEVTIVAVANVLVGKEAAAYYMEAVNVGDYASSGKLASAIGYNWKDLTDGPPPAPQPEALVATPAPVIEPVVPTPAPAETASEPHVYKSSYVPLETPGLFIALHTIMCKELDGRRNDHILRENEAVRIAGTFIKDQILYGRPLGAVKAALWYGVPMDQLISEKELYSTKVDLPTKMAMHFVLTNKEKLVVILSRLTSQVSKLKTIFNKK